LSFSGPVSQFIVTGKAPLHLRKHLTRLNLKNYLTQNRMQDGHILKRSACIVQPEVLYEKKYPNRMTLRFPLLRLSLLLIGVFAAIDVCPNLSAGEKKTGTVEGIVTYAADAKRPWRYARYYVKDRKTGALAESVVALSGAGLKKSAAAHKPTTAVVDQKNFIFIPETTAIRAGDHVKFLNSDKQIHNVKSFHLIHSFNVTLPGGGKHTETFKGATGLKFPYTIGCVYHSAMRAWIFVFDHPHFQVTGKDGKFRLQNVPPGKYQIGMTHRAGELRFSQEVIVKAGATTRVTIRVSPDHKRKKRIRKKGQK
jgi:plastocyanin